MNDWSQLEKLAIKELAARTDQELADDVRNYDPQMVIRSLKFIMMTQQDPLVSQYYVPLVHRALMEARNKENLALFNGHVDQEQKSIIYCFMKVQRDDIKQFRNAEYN